MAGSTPAGRMQAIIEMVQIGMIDMDEARLLIWDVSSPDVVDEQRVQYFNWTLYRCGLVVPDAKHGIASCVSFEHWDGVMDIVETEAIRPAPAASPPRR